MIVNTAQLTDAGYMTGVRWGSSDEAAEVVRQVDGHGEVIRRPWETLPAIAALVRCTPLITAVTAVIGERIALEGGFLLAKQPGADFRVPWHQDGAGTDSELDPDRAVTVWAALTDASAANGALQVIPGSHRHGYLPTRREDAHDGQRGRALTTDVPPRSPDPELVPVPAGYALLMDVRLLHCSDPNTTDATRVGLNLRYVAPGAVRRRDGHDPQPYPITGTGW